MNWCLCLSISACILSYANALWTKSESEEHGSSQKSVHALRQNLDHSQIIASSNNGHDQLDVLKRELQKVKEEGERELQKMKEENELFRSRLLNLEETMKQFQMDILGAPAISVESANGVMKHTKEGKTEAQITKRVDEIPSRSPENSMNLEGQDVKRNNDRGPVAFFAKLSKSLTSLGIDQIIHFNDIVTNIGEGYHTLLGVFIAPVKGLYVFHVRAMVAPGKAQYLGIVRDGYIMQHLYPNSAGNFDTDSVTIVLQVNKGGAVWVSALSGSSYLHGNLFSVFSGWLLSPL